MSIANELSSDIAAAILSSEKHTPARLNELKQTDIKVHLILQELDTGNLKAQFNPHQSKDTGALKDLSGKN